MIDLSNSSGPVISDNQGLGIIIDDDGAIISIDDVTTNPEAATTVDFTVSLSTSSTSTITVDYSTSD